MVAAYDQLLAQGHGGSARKNRGFFVRESRGEPAQAAPEPGNAGSRSLDGDGSATPRVDAPIEATALIRGMFHKVSNKPQPGMGVFPPEWLESTFMPAAVRKVTSTQVAAGVLAAIRRAAWATAGCAACSPTSWRH